jgi:hypothetical protein
VRRHLSDYYYCQSAGAFARLIKDQAGMINRETPRDQRGVFFSVEPRDYLEVIYDTGIEGKATLD